MSNKKRKQISLGKEAQDALELLQKYYPPLSKNSIIELAIISVAKQGGIMFKNNVASISGKPADFVERRDQWCKNLGGEVKAGVCYNIKYDVALNGRVTALKDATQLKDLPEDRDEFERYYLGPYVDVKEAKEALAEQDKKDAAKLMKAKHTPEKVDEEKKETESHEKAIKNAARTNTPEAENAKRALKDTEYSVTDELAKLEKLRNESGS